MSATSGWYPDPGGGPGLYRFWDGQVWSAATSTNPSVPPPSQGVVGYRQPSATGQPSPYAQFQQQTRKRRSPIGWWLAGGALVVVIVIVAAIAVHVISNGGTVGGVASGQASGDSCPATKADSPSAGTDPSDGRVHGGPVSYPLLGSPWSEPTAENRVPFGVDVLSQTITVEENYQPQSSWVASVLVGALQAGDGFFTPEQGSQIVVKCILGEFYGNNPVTSHVIKNQAATIDGHEAWVVESKLSFDIPGLQTKGERLIVAIVAANAETSGLFYASIPDTTPQLLQPARDALAQLKVDG